MKTELRLHTGYMGNAHGSWRRLLKTAKQHLDGVEYDTLVGTGLSGALVIPRLAAALKVNFLIVRKENDDSHSFRKGEGTLGKRWIFVDDLIDTGDTRGRVLKTVNKICDDNDFETTYVGDYLYETYGSKGPRFEPA